MTMTKIEVKESPNTEGRETRSFLLELKANEDGSVEGYGSVFDVEDNYSDVVAPGAFAVTLAEHRNAGTMPAMLWQHDSSKPIGVWTDMVEDEKGLHVKGQLALDTAGGKEAHALLMLKAINGLSIGFITKKWSYDKDTDIRTVEQVDLWEVSLVTFPANKAARITNVKAAEISQFSSFNQMEKALCDVGFSKKSAKLFISKVKSISVAERDAQGGVEVIKKLKALTKTITT